MGVLPDVPALIAGRHFKYINLENVPRPEPPKLPEYDINEEPPMWTFRRIQRNIPYVKPKPYPYIGQQPESPDDPDWRGVIRSKILELPKPTPYTYGAPQYLNYFWFDTPDYADPFKKLWYAFKWYLGTGAIYWSGMQIYVGLDPKQTRAQNYVRMFRKYCVPWVVTGMAASLTCLCLANLRGKKDDCWNYVAAGFLQGSLLCQGCHLKWFRYSIMGSAAGYYIKYANEHNHQILPILRTRGKNLSIGGNDAEHGLWSGDLRIFPYRRPEDPGRDVRKVY